MNRFVLNLNTASGLQPLAAVGAQVGAGLEGIAAPHIAFVAGVKVDAPSGVSGRKITGADSAFHASITLK